MYKNSQYCLCAFSLYRYSTKSAKMVLNDGFEKDEYDSASLGESFFNSMKKYASKIVQFMADTDEIDTFSELLTRCTRTALKLRENNIKPGDIIGICSQNHKNSCVPFIATQFLGAISANFDLNLSHAVTIKLLQLIQPKIMFTSAEALPLMEKCVQDANINVELVTFDYSRKYRNFSEYLEPRENEDDFVPIQIENNRETAVILFSSGTTGYPKGICLSHYTLLKQSNSDTFFEVTESTVEVEQAVFLFYSNLYWITSVGSLIRSLLHGNAKVICAEFDPVQTWKIIEKYKVTFAFLAPYHATEFLACRPKSTNTSSLTVFITGSCPVTKRLMDDLNEVLTNTTVIQGYGQTEAGGLITIFDPFNAEDIEMQRRKPQSCGNIRSCYEWKVVDISSEETLGPNQEGELRIKSDRLMNDYYKMDSSSAYDSQGYLKTGDVVYYDEDYSFYIIDRIKEMFKYRGWHVIPSVLEEVLMNHPAVKEAAVIGIPHEVDGERPMGVIVLNDGFPDVTSKDIELFVNESVYAAQQLRGGVKIINQLPRTSTGKVKRNSVKENILNGVYK